MKVSKRSLIVSIAVLCVCALSLTAASFAWFSASQVATAKNLQLTVAKASDLRISLSAPTAANIEDDEVWLSSVSFDSDDLKGAASTNALPKLYNVANQDDVDAISGAYNPAGDTNVYVDAISENYYKKTVYFRTNEEKAIQLVSGTFNKHSSSETSNEKLLQAMRLGTEMAIFATTEDTTNVVTGYNKADVIEFTPTVFGVATPVTPVAAQFGETDYYTVQLDLYFYVEGTSGVAVNSNTGITIGGQFEFGLV